MSGKKVFYAVRKGRSTGIFNTWNECVEQVKNFSGSDYKKFKTLREAENYLNSITESSISSFRYQVYADGGARGNPGISGCGAVLMIDGKPLSSSSKFLGLKMTNNAAEYHGLLLGLNIAQHHFVKSLEVLMDSLLVVNQIKGEWRINEPNLIILHDKAMKEIEKFKKFKILHIPREENIIADKLANEAMDLANK